MARRNRVSRYASRRTTSTVDVADSPRGNNLGACLPPNYQRPAEPRRANLHVQAPEGAEVIEVMDEDGKVHQAFEAMSASGMTMQIFLD